MSIAAIEQIMEDLSLDLSEEEKIELDEELESKLSIIGAAPGYGHCEELSKLWETDRENIEGFITKWIEKKEKKEGTKRDGSSDEIIALGRCFSCHRAHILKFMVPFDLAEPESDGIIRCRRYLCPDCGERLKQMSWVKEEELKKEKTKKEDKEQNGGKDNNY